MGTWDTNRDIKNKFRYGLQTYHRKLKLASHFNFKNKNKPKPFTSKSQWTPSVHQTATVINNAIKADYIYFNEKFNLEKTEPNLTKEEVKALMKLMKNPNII